MANVSVQIAAVVADTADTPSVIVNVQVAVTAAPAVAPEDPSYEPQPPREPDDNAGPDVVGDADVAAHVAGQPSDPDDASSGPPSLVSTSPASTPRGGTADTAAFRSGFLMTGDGAVIHGGTLLEAYRAVVDADAAAEPPPQPQPQAPPQPEDLEAQDEDAEPQLQTQAQAQATAGAATASAAGAVASAGAAAAAGAGAVAGTAAGPAAGTVAGAAAAAAAGAGAGAGADYRMWFLNRNNVEVWYDDHVQRWRDRRGRVAKGPC